MKDALRVIAVSTLASIATGVLLAVALFLLMGSRIGLKDLPILVGELPALLAASVAVSAPVAVPLGVGGGLVATFLLTRRAAPPRSSWMVRGCVVGGALGFLPFAAWDALVAGLTDGLIGPIIFGVGGAVAGAITGSVLSHSRFPAPLPASGRGEERG